MVRKVSATRYVTPLREGGSVPAIVEADDEGTYVVKFRGAGQGPRVLVAELVAGEIGRALGLPVPEIVLCELDAGFARVEPDPELQAPMKASVGLNLAMDFLPGAIGFDPLVPPPPDAELASAIVWFDAYVTNVDRTVRNPNLLLWHRRLWLIDHGAALYFHHGWRAPEAEPAEAPHAYPRQQARTRFAPIGKHVLLPFASELEAADATLRGRLTPELLAGIVELIPDEWLTVAPRLPTPAEERAGYRAFLEERLAAAPLFVEEAIRARAELV